MRTKVDSIQFNTVLGQQLVKSSVDGIKRRTIEDPPVDRRLIGDNRKPETQPPEQTKGRTSAWEQLHLIRITQIVNFAVYSAVTIEQNKSLRARNMTPV